MGGWKSKMQSQNVLGAKMAGWKQAVRAPKCNSLPRPPPSKGTLAKTGLDLKYLSSLDTLTNFSSGHQESWNGISCWVCHSTDPVLLFLFDYMVWGKSWPTRAISLYSHSDLISEALLFCLPLGFGQSHLCPSWHMSLTLYINSKYIYLHIHSFIFI